MSKAWPSFALLASMALVAGCGTSQTSGDVKEAPTTVVTTVTTTVTAQPKQHVSSGTTSRRLGRAWRTSVATITPIAFRTHVPTVADTDNGEKYWDALLVKTCVSHDLPPRYRKGLNLSWQPWALTDVDAGLYPASDSNYEDFPTPAYPFSGEQKFRSGECAKGWIMFEVAPGTKVTGVRYDNGVDLARWKI
jgi:hypothetical protein